MECKDPNDMTSSELLRSVANQIDPDMSSRDAIDDLRNAVGADEDASYPYDLANALLDLADRIEAEAADARREYLRRAAQIRSDGLIHGARAWAKANSWPDLRDDEDFGEWIERCAIQRPCFDDGEPVQFGDEVAGFDECGIILRQIAFCEGGTVILLDETPETICEVDPGEYVKRPVPEALGADWLPIKTGETLWFTKSGAERTVKALIPRDEGTCEIEFTNGLYCSNARQLTHTPPDTQEKIDEDAKKHYCTYFGGYHACGTCPASADNLSGNTCEKQQVFDLLRRQRELDKRTGGAE